MKKIDVERGAWLRWVGLVAGAAVLWFTQVSAAVAKANAAPTKDEVQLQVSQALTTATQQIEPIKQDVREIKTDVKWLIQEQNKRR